MSLGLELNAIIRANKIHYRLLPIVVMITSRFFPLVFAAMIVSHDGDLTFYQLLVPSEVSTYN